MLQGSAKAMDRTMATPCYCIGFRKDNGLDNCSSATGLRKGNGLDNGSSVTRLRKAMDQTTATP